MRKKTVIFMGLAGTGKPRYYEFRVINGGKEVGAISCVADEQEGAAVRFVLPFNKEITESNARAAAANKGKFIDRGYPGHLFFRENGSNRSVDAATGEEDTTDYPADVKVKDWLEKAEPEILKEFGLSSQEDRDAIIAEQDRIEKENAAFWQKANAVKENILNTSDEELEAVMLPHSERAAVIDYLDITLSTWETRANWYNPSNKCGPTAITFIITGLGPQSGYPNTIVPLSSDSKQQISDKTEALYTLVDSKTPPLWNFWFFADAASYDGLNTALRALTNYKVVKDDWHKWDTVANNISKYKLPAISLRSSMVLQGKLSWHYRVIIGVHKETQRSKYTFLFWDFYNDNTYYWYKLHDNGADGPKFGCWWEQSGQLYHFQSAQIRHK